jgi:predicted nucleic-acid-binding protein
VIGVDTNVLVRYLTKDDEELASIASRFFEARTSADPAFVSLVAAIETYWVLRRSYKFDQQSVSRALRALLETDELVFQAPDVVRRALRQIEDGTGDFADAVIALLAIDADCDYTVTFDRAAAELPGMQLLGK